MADRVKAEKLPVRGMIARIYGFALRASVPTLVATLLYALSAMIGHVLVEYQVFGGGSQAASWALAYSVGVIWFAMALRRALGRSSKGFFGLALGGEEVRLGLSSLGLCFVSIIIVFLLLLFLVIFSMIMVALAGYDGDTLSDPAFFQDVVNRRAFFATIEGQIVQITAAALLGLFIWFLIRLSPFAAGAVAERRVVVLQAMIWTRYHDLRLSLVALATSGVAWGILIGALQLLALTRLPSLLILGVGHVLACFAALVAVAFGAETYRTLVDPDVTAEG